MNLAEWHRHAFLNRLQAIVLIGFMAGFLALLGYLIWGPAGVLQLLFMGIVFALVHRLASPWLVLRLYRARPLRPSEAPALNAAASRTREYHADLNAALLTGDPQGLASALAKIERRQHRFMDWVLPGWGLPEPSWLRTHPPTEERIRRLLALAPPTQAWLPGSHPVRPHGMPVVASLPARPRYHVSGLWY